MAVCGGPKTADPAYTEPCKCSAVADLIVEVVSI